MALENTAVNAGESLQPCLRELLNPENVGAGINKGLEFWGLQALCDLAIAVTFVALVLIAGKCYLDGIRKRLSLRVASELWDNGTELFTDLMLGFAALTGLMIINPDQMADIKVGLPWVPIAMVLCAAALVLRAFHGGRVPGSKAWWIVLVLLVVACMANAFGYTFIMEGADVSEDYKNVAGAWWGPIKDLRSKDNRALTMLTFYCTYPSLLVVFFWAVIAGAARTCRKARTEAADDAT